MEHAVGAGRPDQMTVSGDQEIASENLAAEHPELFHYTDADGLKGIVDCNTFRASHFIDLDDERKLAVLRPLLLREMAELFEDEVQTRSLEVKRRYFNAGGAGPLAEQYLDALYQATFEKNNADLAVDSYTTSFTTHSGDRDYERANGMDTQWKRYGSNGFCIVLDTATIGELLRAEFKAKDFTHLNLEPVRYAEAGVALRDHFPFLEPALRHFMHLWFSGEQITDMGVKEFLRSATLLKAPCFRKEREVRIVAIPGAPGYQRQSANESPTYVARPLPTITPAKKRFITIFEHAGIKLPINRVIIGPSAHQAGNAVLARKLVGARRVVLSRLNID